MSFILDALRKSERERQRGQEPGVAQLWTQGKRGGRTFWIPVVMLLVGLNLSLLVFLWLKGSPETSEVVAVTNTATPAAIANPTPRPQTMIPAEPASQASRRLSAEIPVEQDFAAAPAAATSATPATSPTPTGSSDAYRNLPSLMELTLAGTISLQPLHLDIHVYSALPAERFVFINMRKYHEGDTLNEGPALDAITNEGVVLTHQGRSFILTRD
jgi:general secretion pathway protein B